MPVQCTKLDQEKNTISEQMVLLESFQPNPLLDMLHIFELNPAQL